MLVAARRKRLSCVAVSTDSLALGIALSIRDEVRKILLAMNSTHGEISMSGWLVAARRHRSDGVPGAGASGLASRRADE